MTGDSDHLILLRLKETGYDALNIPPVLLPIREETMNKVMRANGISAQVFTDELIHWLSLDSSRLTKEYEAALERMSYDMGVDKLGESDFKGAIYYFEVSQKYLLNNIEVMRNLGLSWSRAGSFTKSFQYYVKLVELSKSQEIPPQYMAEAAIIAGKIGSQHNIDYILSYLENTHSSWHEANKDHLQRVIGSQTN